LKALLAEAPLLRWLVERMPIDKWVAVVALNELFKKECALSWISSRVLELHEI
jgi:hypothetical protein